MNFVYNIKKVGANMDCNHLNGFIIWSLALLAIGDLLILYAEMRRQHCDRIAEKEKAAELNEMKDTIQKLQQEIENLKTA